MQQRGLRRLGVVVLGVSMAVSACSSSGGGVSQSQLESKLKSEPTLKSVVSQGGTKGKVANQLVDCIAKALKKDADQGDLKKYVEGKLNLNDLGGKSKGAGNNAASVAKSCAQHATQSDESSAPAA